MAESKAVKAIKFFKKRLKDKRLNVSKVILFGSQAEGKVCAESDVDILIISENF